MIKLIQKATGIVKRRCGRVNKRHYRLLPFRIWHLCCRQDFYIIWSKIYSAAIWAEKQFFTQSAALYALRLY